MPLIIASLLRTLIMALVTGGAISAVQQLFSKSMEQIIADVRAGTGISENDALDILHNFIVDTLVNTGVTFALLKARLPVQLADRLGIGGTGISKRVLTPAAKTAVQKMTAAAGGGFLKGTVGKIAAVAGTIGGGIWLVSAIANIIEPGIYKPAQTNAVYKKLGIPFQYPMVASSLQPGPFDGPGFNEYARALETQGISSIENPCAAMSVIYSRQALADLIDCKYGQSVLNGEALTKAKLIPLLAPHLRVAGSAVPTSTSTPTQSQALASAGTSVPTVKVFTGVISQGVLGSGTPFTARPDDLIESVQDLQDAASNNLAAALAALTSSLSYEIKIQSSIITKEGFKQTGASQQIITGYSSTGQPKYKTVVNKFAVLNIYLMTEKGSRTKVRTVVLGPTNVLKFNPTGAQVSGIENVVKTSIITSNPADISSVVRNVPVEDSSAETQASSPQGSDPYGVGNKVRGGAANSDGTIFYEYTYEGDGKWSVADTVNGKYPGAYKTTAELRSLGVSLAGSSAVVAPAPASTSAGQQSVAAPTQAATVPRTSSAGSTATTLYEWYSARGQALPGVAARSLIYQGFGLGQAAFYTGTAEQNTKLLNALKAQG